MGLGDYSYENTGDCWFKSAAPILDKMKIAIGNHELENSKLKGFMDYFNITHQYYSLDEQNVHFLAMATDESFDVGSLQYDFVSMDLKEAASNPDIKWKVVYFHRMMYTSPNVLTVSEPLLASIYHPIFQKYQVDLVLQGHLHAYERSYPLTFNTVNPDQPTVMSRNHSNYENSSGLIYSTVGTGGAFSLEYEEDKSDFVAQQYQGYG